MINVFQPSLGNEELDSIRQVFESNWLGKGKRVDEFEQKYADYLSVDKRNIYIPIIKYLFIIYRAYYFLQ